MSTIRNTPRSKQPEGGFQKRKHKKVQTQRPRGITPLKHKYVFVGSDERITLEEQMKLAETKQKVSYITKKAYEILQLFILNYFVSSI